MSKTSKNPVRAFFASVKLALFLLFILAATSIIGTVIPQNKPAEFYISQYGENMANLMQTLGVPDMYNCWWFLGLLGIFSLNLFVCSLERIPNVIRILKKDNLTIDPERLGKMKIRKTIPLSGTMQEAEQRVDSFLNKKGWNTEKREKDGGTLLFSQKGGWTRFGVYIVHTSILTVLLGAVIGSSMVARKILRNPDFAFKGSITLPETKGADFIYSYQTGEKIKLGFTVRCDFFTIEYYPNGTPKTYLSRVSVLEDGKPVMLKDGETVHFLKVNKPLTYKGVTFYQASYQAYQDFVVTIKNETTRITQSAIIPAGKEIGWKEGGVNFGIINQEHFGEEIRRVKVWFTDNQGDASSFWVNAGQEAVINRPSGDYTFQAKQLYATGLQVTKDPGVWTVYIGCMMMLVGLMIAFFMSHRKIYAFIHKEDGQPQVLFAGSVNKNKIGFEKKFIDLTEDFKI